MGAARRRDLLTGRQFNALAMLFARPLVALLAISVPALADGIYKDRGVRQEVRVEKRAYFMRSGRSCDRALLTRTTCSVDYVGSDLGLSKPSYYGTRIPDDGVPMGQWLVP